MPDSKQLLSKWIHRKGSNPIEPASLPPEASNHPATDNPGARAKSGNIVESVLDNLTLALSLAEQAVDIAQVAPFIAPAAALLSEIIKSYKVRFNSYVRSIVLIFRFILGSEEHK